jgi:hypothetical protein
MESLSGRPIRGLALAAIFATLALHAQPAGAADSDGTFAVEGVGQTACREFVTAAKERSAKYYNYGGWIEGYLTAYNQVSDDTYDVTPFEGIDLLAALLRGFCTNNPDVPFFQAISSMVRELEPHRLKVRDEPVTTEAGGKQVMVYTTVLKRAQQALAEAGFYDGGIDGAYGPRTRDAFKAFQAAEGLEQTGLPDQVTLLRLLRAARQ